MELLDNRSLITKQARKVYSRIGLACFLMLFAPYVVIAVLSAVVLLSGNTEFLQSNLFKLLSGNLSMYLIGVPIACAIVAPVKTYKAEKQRLSPKAFFIYFLIALSLMYSGALITKSTISVFSFILGKETSDVLETAINTLSLEQAFITLCILAPIVEEFIFRKIILDRTRCFGEGVSIFIGAAIFSLFHANPGQFLYAFSIGLVLGYVYMRYSNIWYTMLMHGILNLFGGFVPVLTERLADFSHLAGIIAGVIATMCAMSVLAATVIGIILMKKHLKKIRFLPTCFELSKKEHVKAALLNAGMILYITGLLLFTVWVVITLI